MIEKMMLIFNQIRILTDFQLQGTFFSSMMTMKLLFINGLKNILYLSSC